MMERGDKLLEISGALEYMQNHRIDDVTTLIENVTLTNKKGKAVITVTGGGYTEKVTVNCKKVLYANSRIPQYELADQTAPTCSQIDAARTTASQYIDVFRHCQHCRADAVGVPGRSEYGDQIYQRKLRVRETFSHG